MITKEMLANVPVQNGCIFLAPDGRYLTVHDTSIILGGRKQLGLTADINQAYTGWSIPTDAKYSDDFPKTHQFITLGSRIQSVRIVRLAEPGPPPAPPITPPPPVGLPKYHPSNANTDFDELT